MSRFQFEDKLEILGILAGAFVVIVGLGTLSGMPWTTNEETAAVVVQMLGIVIMIAVGIILVSISYSGDLRDLLSRSAESDD